MAGFVEGVRPDPFAVDSGAPHRLPDAARHPHTEPIRPLLVFAAYEANRDRNGGRFVPPESSRRLFPSPRTPHNSNIDMLEFMRSMDRDRGKSNPVGWGDILAESVAELISEVALEANTRGMSLELDVGTRYKVLGVQEGDLLLV